MFSPAPEPLWALTALGKCHLKTDGVKQVLVLYLPGGGEGGVGLLFFFINCMADPWILFGVILMIRGPGVKNSQLWLQVQGLLTFLT